MITGIVLIVLFLFRKPINRLVMTRGYKNNNFGNIRKTYDPKGNLKLWTGEIIGTDKDFKTFKNPAFGYRALIALLHEYNSKGYNSIDKIITRFAPSNENNTLAYISSVSKMTGLQPTTPVNFTDTDEVKKLVAAISYHENGIKANEADIEAGYKIFKTEIFMDTFQVIMVCIGFLTLLGGLVASFTKAMVEIAKIQVQIKNLEHDSDQKEKAILKLEQQNSTEHKEIINRLNRLIEKGWKANF